MSKEEAVRRQVAENARLRVQAEALETKLAKIRTEIRDDDTAADHKELVRFEAATAAVREAAPVAARQNASASARLNAARLIREQERIEGEIASIEQRIHNELEEILALTDTQAKEE